ncbi:MAG: energy-coupling factor ABC transporter permease [Peptostreptococcaceae bacterium]|nr:energy-coupling factor ABC transporter permease [Peptostreptococcaceae bacterium]
MHMADALLSPSVGLVMAAVTIGAIAYSVNKIKKDESFDEKKIPIMAVSGAFIFAAQMINFTIPGTGSSGHIGGGILLAALLGPFPALLTMAAVLIIQCLFFADGGLLALGANIFNMGVIVSFVSYPLIFKPIVSKGLTPKRITLATIAAVVIGLQLGAFSVVLETMASGITELPFHVFLLLMQPIHLVIGLTEGVVTAAVLCFIYSMRPEIMEGALTNKSIGSKSIKKVLIALGIFTILLAAGFSLLASSFPDGLEWAIGNITGGGEIEKAGNVYNVFGEIQELFAFMPDYSLKTNPEQGTSLAGIIGGTLTLVLAGVTGIVINVMKKRKVAKR